MELGHGPRRGERIQGLLGVEVAHAERLEQLVDGPLGCQLGAASHHDAVPVVGAALLVELVRLLAERGIGLGDDDDVGLAGDAARARHEGPRRRPAVEASEIALQIADGHADADREVRVRSGLDDHGVRRHRV